MFGRMFPSWSHLGPCLKSVILFISLLVVGRGEGGYGPSIQDAAFSLMPLFPILSLDPSTKPNVLEAPSLSSQLNLSSSEEKWSNLSIAEVELDCRVVAGLCGGRQSSKTLTLVLLCLILTFCGTLWLMTFQVECNKEFLPRKHLWIIMFCELRNL